MGGTVCQVRVVYARGRASVSPVRSAYSRGNTRTNSSTAVLRCVISTLRSGTDLYPSYNKYSTVQKLSCWGSTSFPLSTVLGGCVDCCAQTQTIDEKAPIGVVRHGSRDIYQCHIGIEKCRNYGRSYYCSAKQHYVFCYCNGSGG